MADAATVITDPVGQDVIRFVGFTTTIDSQFTNGSHPKGIDEVDDGFTPLRLADIDTIDDQINLLGGFAAVLVDQIDPRPNGDEFGCHWHNTEKDLYTTSYLAPATDTAWRYDGFSASLVDQLGLSGFLGSTPAGLTFDEASDIMMLSNRSNGFMTENDGFTNTVLDSFTANIAGGFLKDGDKFSLYWDVSDGDLLVMEQTASNNNTVYALDGFSTTQTGTLTVPGNTTARGVTRSDTAQVFSQTLQPGDSSTESEHVSAGGIPVTATPDTLPVVFSAVVPANVIITALINAMQMVFTTDITVTSSTGQSWTFEPPINRLEAYEWRLPNNDNQHVADTVGPGDLLIKPSKISLVPTKSPKRSGVQHGADDWDYENAPDSSWRIFGPIED